jgi:ABC-type multidrug transport system fused ATPase/permease subunit
MPNPALPQLLRRLWQHINPRRRVQFGLLFLVMILASIAEVLSIGAVLPFLGALIAPERIFGHPMAQPFIHALNLTEPKQLLLPLTIAFAMAALFSGAMRLILLWTQTRLCHAIGADFSISIYRRTLYQPDVGISFVGAVKYGADDCCYCLYGVWCNLRGGYFSN